MPTRFAVIDLGTNTFHLSIAEKGSRKNIKEIYKERYFVKLAEEGIEKIGAIPFQRGLNALQNFRLALDKFEVKNLKAIGTAALRTALNGQEFIGKVKENFGIVVELVDGDREADLIYKGVTLAVPFQDKNYLLMDIGGGSVEFIIANRKGVLWAQSFLIGVAVLFKGFHHSDPMQPKEKEQLETFLDQQLKPLYAALAEFPTPILVGASGTFDVLEFILAKNKNHKNHCFVQVKDFQPLYETLLHSTVAERFAMKDVPDTRVDMIVVAVILIDFILKKSNAEEIIISRFAMKEGILGEMMGMHL